MADSIGFGRRGSIDLGSQQRLPLASVYTATLSQQVIDLINSGSGGTINPTSGLTNVSGNLRGISDSSFFAWDQGLDAIGFTKHTGFHGALSYAAGAASGTMTLDIVEYTGQSTINPTSGGSRLVRARWDNSGNFIQYQNATVQGSFAAQGVSTFTGVLTANGSITANAGLTGTTAALSTSVSAPTITQNGNQVTDTISVTNNVTSVVKSGNSYAITNSLTPTFTSATVSTTNPNFVLGDGTNAGRVALASGNGAYHSSALTGDVVVQSNNNSFGTVISGGPSSTGYIRVAGGGTTVGGTLGVTGTSTLTGNVTIGNGSGAPLLLVQGAAGQFRGMGVYSGTSLRWAAGANGAAESGSNAGTDWGLFAYADDGTTLLGNRLLINRASGLVSAVSGALSSTLSVTGTTTINSTLDLSGSTATITATNGGVGDKVSLYAASLATRFGFGVQSGRLVAFMPSGDAFSIRATTASGQASAGSDVITLSGSGVITATGTGNFNGTGTSSSGGAFVAANGAGVYNKNVGVHVGTVAFGVTAEAGGATYLKNTTNGGISAYKALQFKLTDGTIDVGRIHSTAVPIIGGGTYTITTSTQVYNTGTGYSGSTWVPGDIATNSIYGTGGQNGATNQQLTGTGYGNLALYTVGSDNLVDGAITASKLSLPAIASVIASGAGNNTSNSFFRFAYTGNSYIDPASQQQLSDVSAPNGSTVVSDPQAYQAYAVKIPSTTANGTIGQSFAAGLTLPDGLYSITVFVRVSANTSSSAAATFSVSTSTGTATITGSPSVNANQLSTTGYMGYSFALTLAGGQSVLRIRTVSGGLVDVFVSHITGIPVAATFQPYLSTVFTPNIFATSATISSVSATSLVSGTINSDNIFLGTGGHLYAGPTAALTTTYQARVDLGSGGLFAYNGINTAYNGMGGPGVSGPAGQVFRLGADGTLRLKGDIVSGSTITGADLKAVGTDASPGSISVTGLSTDNAMTIDTLNGLRVMVEATTNVVVNPSFMLNLTAPSGASCTSVIDTSRAFVGTRCLKLTSTGSADAYVEITVPVTAGLTYSYSAYSMNPSNPGGAAPPYSQGGNGGGLFIYFPQAGNVGASTGIAQPKSTWTREKINNYGTPAGCTYVIVRLYCPNTSGAIVWWDAIQVEQKSRVTRYCDGDQYGCVWNGTIYNSTSSRAASAVVTQLGINDQDVFSGTLIGGNIFGATIAGSKFVSYGTGSSLLQFSAAGITQVNNAGTTTISTDVNGNVDITGKIQATSGYIGTSSSGWNFDANSIYSGGTRGGNNNIEIRNSTGVGPYIRVGGTGTEVVMDGRSGQTYQLYAYNGSIYTFGIDKAGNASFTGTITGGLFRTAVSGNRIEITSATTDRINMYSGLASETVGYLQATNNAGQGQLIFSSPGPVGGQIPQILMESSSSPAARIKHFGSEHVWSPVSGQSALAIGFGSVTPGAGRFRCDLGAEFYGDATGNAQPEYVATFRNINKTNTRIDVKANNTAAYASLWLRRSVVANDTTEEGSLTLYGQGWAGVDPYLADNLVLRNTLASIRYVSAGGHQFYFGSTQTMNLGSNGTLNLVGTNISLVGGTGNISVQGSVTAVGNISTLSAVTASGNVTTNGGRLFPNGIAGSSAVTTDASSQVTITHNLGNTSYSPTIMTNNAQFYHFQLTTRNANTMVFTVRNTAAAGVGTGVAITTFWSVIPY